MKMPHVVIPPALVSLGVVYTVNPSFDNQNSYTGFLSFNNI